MRRAFEFPQNAADTGLVPDWVVLFETRGHPAEPMQMAWRAVFDIAAELGMSLRMGSESADPESIVLSKHLAPI